MCGWLMATGIGRENKTNKKLLDHGGISLKHFERCPICKSQHAAEGICKRLQSPGHVAIVLFPLGTRKAFGWALCVLPAEWHCLLQFAVDERSGALLNTLKIPREIEICET